MTSYLVFLQVIHGDERSWSEVETVEAHDAKGAIAAAVVNLDKASGALDLDGAMFAACPAKGWRSEAVTVKTETRVTVGA